MEAALDRVGAYRLLRRIGAGGMGEVWLAEHAMLGRRAAIKLLNASFAARPDVVTRFFNEARAATAIADPGIVQIFDFGHHTDGSAYIVMELLDGETLDARWRRDGLPLGDALRIMRQVASSLGAAHACGIVHRDLKPENIFLVRDPEVPGGERAKILDFGIAKLAADPGLKTQTSVVMGTPAFMSPEQCRGAGLVDQRSDVYSLGCVLFAIATGRPPFVAEGTGELIAMHLREAPPRAATIAPHVPPAVDELIARCLEKDPALRFASGTALAGALGALITAPGPATAGTGHAQPTTLSSSIAVVSPARGRRPLVAAGAALALACLAFAIWRAGGGGDRAALAPPPPPVLADAAPALDAMAADAPIDAAEPIHAPLDAAPHPPVKRVPPRIKREPTPEPKREPAPEPKREPAPEPKREPTPPPRPPDDLDENGIPKKW